MFSQILVMSKILTNPQKLSILFLFMFVSILQINAQEICDNAIDDDNDGLIDLNDSDCVCSDLMASSLIPNPSFEEMNCCPNTEAELNCADGWIQASEPTTDYVHTCGVLGNPFLGFEAPLPFPDGEGAIGFRDGKPGFPNFKEYAGACLTQAMTIGTEYRLDFFVGFHDEPGSLNFDMAIFGTTDCGNLPFGNGNQDFGCPTNGPGWVELGAMTVSGVNEWKNVIFNFVADQNYEAIVLGPACAINPNINQDPYFFFDRLVLAESIMFEVPLAEITGNICENSLVLTSSDAMGGSYQWYKDGVALIGETNQSLSLQNDGNANGTYEVVITTSTGCFNGEAYDLEVPIYESIVEEKFCEGGSIVIDGQEFNQAGTFDLQLVAEDGCDSLVTLVLESTALMTETITFEGCEGDEIIINNESYSTGGNYTQNLTSVDGCDSILTIQYFTSTDSSSDLEFDICSGDVISINGESYSVSGNYTQTISNVAGCDSVINISILSATIMEGSVAFEICDGEEIEVNGELYNQSGGYTQGLTSVSGCDSLLTITITSLANAESNLQYSICDNESVTINDQVYNMEGSYTQTLIANNGCDSIIHINIFLEDICSDCIFYTEFNSGSIELSKLSKDRLNVNLVNDGNIKISSEMGIEQFLQFSALYLVDNEIQEQGKLSKIEDIINGRTNINSLIAECNWKLGNTFTVSEITKSLPYSNSELPNDINTDKLNHLYQNILYQLEELRPGANMKINYR